MVEHRNVGSFKKKGKHMIDQVPIVDRLKVYAEDGRTSAPLRLWKGQIKKLEKEGFFVFIKAPTKRYGEFSCTISWKYPKGDHAAHMLAITISALTQNMQDYLEN